MSRSIVTYDYRKNATAELAPKPGETAPPPEDKYKDRLLKYIPGEVVTLYLTLTALQGTAPGLPWWLGWAIFLVCAAGTWFYLRVVLRVEDPTQLFISTLSFGVWVFALGGPFKDLGWYKPIYGGLLLPAFTFFVAMIPTAPQKTP
jgi:hypothetical protein